MKHILDAGAVMNTALLPRLKGSVVVPESVRDEIKSAQANHLLAVVEGRTRISIVQPLPNYLDRTREIALEMGQDNLSRQDLDVLAVALMYHEQEDVEILSDDYGVRNIAHELGIASRGITTSGGHQKRTYSFVCTACGASYNGIQLECDICGHDNFRRRRRS